MKTAVYNNIMWHASISIMRIVWLHAQEKQIYKINVNINFTIENKTKPAQCKDNSKSKSNKSRSSTS